MGGGRRAILCIPLTLMFSHSFNFCAHCVEKFCNCIPQIQKYFSTFKSANINIAMKKKKIILFPTNQGKEETICSSVWRQLSHILGMISLTGFHGVKQGFRSTAGEQQQYRVHLPGTFEMQIYWRQNGVGNGHSGEVLIIHKPKQKQKQKQKPTSDICHLLKMGALSSILKVLQLLSQVSTYT